MNIILDSSVYISAYLTREERSSVSLSCLTRLNEDNEIEIILFRLVLFEIATILMTHGEPEIQVRAFLNVIKNGSLFPVRELKEELEETFYVNFGLLRLKTSDLLILLTAFEERAILLTWDKPLLREANKIIRCFTPEEFLKLTKKRS